MGITAQDFNYVQLEVNPRVEFIVDKKFKVVSFAPLNEEASIILSNEDFKGMDIDSACTKYLDICARTGYIDVDGTDNAVNLTVIDGLTQTLDVHIAENIYNYFTKNEILCAVVENYEDRNMFDEKEEHQVSCSNKYKLITTIMEKDPSQSIRKLRRLSEKELIDIVANTHSNTPYKTTSDNQIKKNELLSKNSNKYDNHIKKITNESQKEFSNLFSKHQTSSTEQYKTNFSNMYNKWQEHI